MEKGKNIILIIILSLVVIGLGVLIIDDRINNDEVVNENNNNNQNNGNENNDLEPTEDIWERLLQGDFSGFAGEWENYRGEVRVLLPDGSFENEDNKVLSLPIRISLEDEYFWAEGTYTWTTTATPNGIGVILPVGVPLMVSNPDLSDILERPYIEFSGDNSRIRLFTLIGGPEPLSEDIFYKR